MFYIFTLTPAKKTSTMYLKYALTLISNSIYLSAIEKVKMSDPTSC